MPNKYNDPQGNRDPNDRPLSSTEQEDIQYQRERAAENGGVANGLLIGGVLTALLGLGGGLAYYFFGNQSPVVPTTIINNPPNSSPVAPASSAPEKQPKVIERTVEKTAPPQVIEVPKPVLVPGETKVIEVPKPVLVPGKTKVIEVPKPVLVPGETKATEAPKPFSNPTIPGTAQKSASPSSTPAATSKSPESVNPALPSSPSPNNY